MSARPRWTPGPGWRAGLILTICLAATFPWAAAGADAAPADFTREAGRPDKIPPLTSGETSARPPAGKSPVSETASETSRGFVQEVFPVPLTVRQIFRGAGVRAFNPFHVWGPAAGDPFPQAEQPAQVSAEEAALLPPGPVYEVVPAWTAIGLRPQPGTRVLYHPATGLLFGRIAGEDWERVRDLCSWPLRVWAASFSDDDDAPDLSGYQPQLAVSTWLVPAAGPGGWAFQPLTPPELMTLPEKARVLAGRQRMIVRTGQRAMVRAERHSATDPESSVEGLQFEAELSCADDGINVDVNTALSLTRRLHSTGRVVTLSCPVQRSAPRGDSWLVEAGILPDDPPLRVFHILSLPEKPVVPPSVGSRARIAMRWRETFRDGTPPAAPTADIPKAAGSDFMVITDGNFQYLIQDTLSRARKPAPSRSASVGGAGQTAHGTETAADAPFDPLAGTSRPDPWEGLPLVKIPEWFDDEAVQEVSAVITKALQLAPNRFGAWKWHDLYFLKGDAAVLEEIRQKLHGLSLPEPPPSRALEVILTLRPSPSPAAEAASSSGTADSTTAAPGTGGRGRGDGDMTLSRVLLPVVAGQDYEITLKNQGGMAHQDFEETKTMMGKLSLSLPRDRSWPASADAVEKIPQPVSITATLSLSPPLTPNPLAVSVLIPALEDRVSVAEIAHLPGRGVLLMSLRRHDSPTRPAPPPKAETILEMWWAATSAGSLQSSGK